MELATHRELLPIEETTPDTPLRVGWSPLYEEPKLAELLGLKRLWVKDDGINPTASLKDRASAMAVAKAGEAGAKIIACSSTGNAASSLAGNAAAAGFKTYIFVPERAPKGKVAQLMIFGANVISVKGNYEETFKMSAEAIEKWGWYNRNAAINISPAAPIEQSRYKILIIKPRRVFAIRRRQNQLHFRLIRLYG